MIKRIRQYQRYRDYYALKTFEVKIALLVTVVLGCFFLVKFDFYKSFLDYQEDIKQLLLMLVGGEFTLLGMSLAGMAIITSIFPSEVLKVINRIDKNDTINRILSQFEFSALNLGIQATYLIIIYLLIISHQRLANMYVFSFSFSVVVYHYVFNIFYIVALIGNCIEINEIKNTCTDISSNDRCKLGVANEIRIEYILALLLKEKGITRNMLLTNLFDIIDKSNIGEKQEIKDYLSSYYQKR